MKISDQLKCSDLIRDPESGVFSYPHIQGFPGGSVAENLPGSAGDIGDEGLIPGSGRSPGVGMETHSSVLAWKIRWTEEPGGLGSMGPQRAGHD